MKTRIYYRSHFIKFVLLICLLIGILLIGFRAVSVTAGHTEVFDSQEKYYTSIIVTSGDTLWTIADEYMGNHYDQASDYIEEVVSINQLQSDTIHAGESLVIPYFK
ncbi:cell division suppressor protein YneA [Eubacterium oxidoreducens]|uniref:LysM domain-containing protein n=1 Tax=Eubacterium oxidoreducens TaxID=1732 RepID=A0A1G6ALR6_EUBOX|nr:LysM peptidoglycan-binding domain-containing protein [Eubacterium oxidoreducens]SDB09335.1 LysM domain-containing protein [Eubacterium oxidoreducens]